MNSAVEVAEFSTAAFVTILDVSMPANMLTTSMTKPPVSANWRDRLRGAVRPAPVPMAELTDTDIPYPGNNDDPNGCASLLSLVV